MARQKDNRKIKSGVLLPVAPRDAKGEPRLDGNGKPLRASDFKTFNAGQEDELEAHMTPEQMEHLKAKGAIEGDWKPGSADPKALKALQEEKDAERREAEEKAVAETEKANKAAAHPHSHQHAAGHQHAAHTSDGGSGGKSK